MIINSWRGGQIFAVIRACGMVGHRERASYPNCTCKHKACEGERLHETSFCHACENVLRNATRELGCSNCEASRARGRSSSQNVPVYRTQVLGGEYTKACSARLLVTIHAPSGRFGDFHRFVRIQESDSGENEDRMGFSKEARPLIYSFGNSPCRINRITGNSSPTCAASAERFDCAENPSPLAFEEIERPTGHATPHVPFSPALVGINPIRRDYWINFRAFRFSARFCFISSREMH